ncbi:hypothetical protein [Streptomyces sp. CT34]|uniref:hypothetical protein n=1 Tax=Streptomyces sp. CT34 TaxID=1553907 RepID=UPI0019D6AC7F|nr:hypothetical protein [Streptomyces sp. CT34]
MLHHPNCPDCLRADHIHGHVPPDPPKPDPPMRTATFMLLFLILLLFAGGLLASCGS